MPTIKQLRESKGWTQEQLARRAGVSWPTISRIENDARNPSQGTLRLLALALEISPDELIEFYHQKNKPTGE